MPHCLPPFHPLQPDDGQETDFVFQTRSRVAHTSFELSIQSDSHPNLDPPAFTSAVTVLQACFFYHLFVHSFIRGIGPQT